MKVLFFLFISIAVFWSGMYGQQIAGEYYLKGVMETASGFRLNKDSTFEFFFSYGALDRYGSGKWSFQNGAIILNGKPYPGKDFLLASRTKSNDGYVTVKIVDSDAALYSFVHCLIRSNDNDSLIDANQDGIMFLPERTDSIRLVSELCSERISSFGVDTTKFNYFIFRFEPWAMEVFFKDFPLRFAYDHLEGRHPLLGDKNYSFERN